ncbi:polysaccharide deacetylase family protein [Conexibacter sp. CPCC 206217]|uniref:polysaccharide deacetylase family protein n=1 Tax=Conexibacter sp. CPCC 206217 TaxID=3064574 RepID=UPI002717C479|nr:polysaccharide deacetylase family protein [Conexibacter sp. CPCC 206217]MDO8209933.1 polysaccharide deacetylase family protein [Conexibacter sp. CPCC 206217]
MSRRLPLLATLTLALIAIPTGVVAAPAPDDLTPVASAAGDGGGGAAPGNVPPAQRPGSGTGDDAPVEPQDTGTALAPLGLRSAALTQDGSVLAWTATTNARWSPASLRRNRQTLCLRLVYEAGGVQSREVCVRRTGATTTLTLARVLKSGGHGPLHALSARVSHRDPRAISARFTLEKAGIPEGSAVRWRVLSSTDGCNVGGTRDCFRARPANGAVLQLRVPLPVGCIPNGPDFVTNGSRAKRVVALTFDDGPSTYTNSFLDVLKQKGVKATFFMIGQQVAPNASIARRVLAEGHEIGDHTWSHPNVSAGGAFASGQITSTANAIQTATGFRPCAFRAPGGAISGSLTSLARGLGFNTIQWDVDTNDWQLPGTEADYQRVVNGVHNGSIVLMHDGGGPRSQGLAALPRIIDTLKARGYGFVTVAQLIGATMTYR